MSRASKLTPEIALKIADADDRYFAAKRALETAKEQRATVRDRYRHLFRLGKPRKAGGVEILVRKVGTPMSFRIADYLKVSKLTAAMRPHFSEGGAREDWRVERLPEDPS